MPTLVIIFLILLSLLIIMTTFGGSMTAVKENFYEEIAEGGDVSMPEDDSAEETNIPTHGNCEEPISPVNDEPIMESPDVTQTIEPNYTGDIVEDDKLSDDEMVEAYSSGGFSKF